MKVKDAKNYKRDFAIIAIIGDIYTRLQMDPRCDRLLNACNYK